MSSLSMKEKEGVDVSVSNGANPAIDSTAGSKCSPQMEKQ
jgi:hypothetical protein